MINVASRDPLFSSRGSNVIEGFEFWVLDFPLIIFGLFSFKVSMVEHGSDACPMFLVPYR